MSKQMNNLAIKAGSWYLISNFLLNGIAIITTPIFTRLLTPYEFGITNTYTSWIGILTIIGTLDIYSCIQIVRNDYDDDEMDKYISSILTLSSLSLFILYIIIKIAGNRLLPFISLPNMLIDVMFIEVFMSNAFTIMQTKQRADLNINNL
jgi:O-antigen/teichoic acid export membrane protein